MIITVFNNVSTFIAYIVLTVRFSVRNKLLEKKRKTDLKTIQYALGFFFFWGGGGGKFVSELNFVNTANIRIYTI